MPDVSSTAVLIVIVALRENGFTVRGVNLVRRMPRAMADKCIAVTTDFIRLVLRHANPVRLTPPVRALKAVMQDISPANPVIIDQIIISVLPVPPMRHVLTVTSFVTAVINWRKVPALKDVLKGAPFATVQRVKNANPTDSFIAISALPAIQLQ